MKIAQAILAKPHHRETAAEIYEAAAVSEENRMKYWAEQKRLKKEREKSSDLEEKSCTHS